MCLPFKLPILRGDVGLFEQICFWIYCAAFLEGGALGFSDVCLCAGLLDLGRVEPVLDLERDRDFELGLVALSW